MRTASTGVVPEDEGVGGGVGGQVGGRRTGHQVTERAHARHHPPRGARRRQRPSAALSCPRAPRRPGRPPPRPRWGARRRSPASSSRPGTTRRLLSSSSVSLRSAKAPTRPSTCVAGRPGRRPQAPRSARIRSRCGTGSGAARLTGPDELVALEEEQHGPHEVVAVDPGDVLVDRPRRARRDRAGRARAGSRRPTAAVGAHHHRRAQRDLAGPRDVGLGLGLLPAARDPDAVLPVERHVGLLAADDRRWPRRVAASGRPVGVDRGGAHLQPDPRRPRRPRDRLARPRAVDSTRESIIWRRFVVGVAAADRAARRG